MIVWVCAAAQALGTMATGRQPTPAPIPAPQQPDQPCVAVLDGVLKRVTFCNSETGYTIARIRDGGTRRRAVRVAGGTRHRHPASQARHIASERMGRTATAKTHHYWRGERQPAWHISNERHSSVTRFPAP